MERNELQHIRSSKILILNSLPMRIRLVQSFNSGQIDGFGNVSPEDIASINRPDNIISWPTSRYYAVFFNQSVNLALQDPAVREALSTAFDRNDLITTALGGNGTPEYGPIPQGAPYYSAPSLQPRLRRRSRKAFSITRLDGRSVQARLRSKVIQKIHGAACREPDRSTDRFPCEDRHIHPDRMAEHRCASERDHGFFERHR